MTVLGGYPPHDGTGRLPASKTPQYWVTRLKDTSVLGYPACYPVLSRHATRWCPGMLPGVTYKHHPGVKEALLPPRAGKGEV